MSKRLILIISLCFLISCENKNETIVKDIDTLIEDEKFSLAQDKIKNKLEGKRTSDEILSNKKPINQRIIEVSNDRNRVVWTEDKQITFRDLANPLSKSLTFPDIPEMISVSSEAEYAIVLFKLPNGAGCRMVNVSLIEPKPSYLSDTYVSCKNRSAVSSDGSSIYYFINENLYEETLKDPKKPKLLVSKERFESIYPNVKNRTHIFSISKTFLIFFGNAGVYNLYWFNPKDNSITKLASEIITPKLYYGNGKNAFVLAGVVGSLLLREIKYTSYGEPSITKGFSITYNEINPFPTTKVNEFISGKSGSIYKWGTSIQKRVYPIIADKFWVVARDYIIYENNAKELILTSTEFSPEDWKLLDLYKQVKQKSK
jgi:hypothetical protein